MATVRRCGRSIPASRSFVDVLPVEPVMPMTCAPSARRHAVARRCSAASGSSAASSAPGSRTARPRRARARRARPTRRRASACGGEAPAVDVLARQADEQVARARRRASRSPRARGPVPSGAGCDEPRARRLGDALRRPAAHAAPPARPSTSSNGTLRPSANSWPCSWPLPAMTTTSPSRGQRRSPARSPRAGRPRRARPRARCRPTISATIASGSSERGLSLVTIDDVGQPRGDRAHQRALAAVAVAARAEDDDHPRRRPSSRAARSTLSSESGVCA